MLLRWTSVGCAVSTGLTSASANHAASRAGVDALRGDAIERVGDAPPLRRRAGERVRAPAPVLVDVLGDVREVREVAERANDMQRLARSAAR